MHIAKGQRATSDSFSVLQFGFQLWIYKQSSPKAAPQATVTSDDGQRSWFAFATPSLPKWVTCSLHAEFRNYKNHLSQKWLHGCTKRVTLASVSRVGWELEVAGGGQSALPGGMQVHLLAQPLLGSQETPLAVFCQGRCCVKGTGEAIILASLPCTGLVICSPSFGSNSLCQPLKSPRFSQIHALLELFFLLLPSGACRSPDAEI